VFRDALERHLKGYEPAHALIAAMRLEVTKKVSFHLAVPMMESWFFADPLGVARAGVDRQTPVRIRQGDVEDFLTVDPAYEAADESACPEWCRRRQPRGDRPKWLGSGDRTRHPKGYLQWLMRDGSQITCTSYKEAERGRAALEQIDWAELLKYKKRCAYVRSLVSDIADLLKQAPSIPSWQGLEAPVTSRSGPRASRVLRNL
jgi:hypothetical protein